MQNIIYHKKNAVLGVLWCITWSDTMMGIWSWREILLHRLVSGEDMSGHLARLSRGSEKLTVSHTKIVLVPLPCIRLHGLFKLLIEGARTLSRLSWYTGICGCRRPCWVLSNFDKPRLKKKLRSAASAGSSWNVLEPVCQEVDRLRNASSILSISSLTRNNACWTTRDLPWHDDCTMVLMLMLDIEVPWSSPGHGAHPVHMATRMIWICTTYHLLEQYAQ